MLRPLESKQRAAISERGAKLAEPDELEEPDGLAEPDKLEEPDRYEFKWSRLLDQMIPGSPQAPRTTVPAVNVILDCGDGLAIEQHEMNPDYLWLADARLSRARKPMTRAIGLKSALVTKH